MVFAQRRPSLLRIKKRRPAIQNPNLRQRAAPQLRSPLEFYALMNNRCRVKCTSGDADVGVVSKPFVAITR